MANTVADDVGGVSGAWRWLRRLAARTSSLETLAAMVAVVLVPALWLFPAVLPVGAFVLLVLTLLLLSAEGKRAYWTGRFLTERLVFVVAAVTSFGVSDRPWAALGGVLAAAAVVGGSVVRGPIRRLNSGVAANLPGVRGYSDMWRFNRVTHVIVGLCVVVVAAGVVWNADEVPLLGGVVAAVVALVLAVATLRNRRRSHAARRDAFRALEKLEPVFYLMWDAPSTGYYQITMWLPYLKRIGLPFAVIVRTKDQLASIARVSDVPVMFCRSMADVDKTVLPSLRTVFYVNTALRNAHYLRFNGLHHVQLNHGDSDKPASASKQFRSYDVNFVAGQAAVDRFAKHDVHVAPFQLRVVGRPQVEVIEAPRRDVTRPTVLYAPTWSGFFEDSDFSSLYFGERIVDELLARGCRVIFRPHAFTTRRVRDAVAAEHIRHRLREHAASSGVDHVYGERAEQEMSVFDCFNASDAMIADVSSIVTDYLFSEKPLAMVAVRRTVDEFRLEFPVAEFAYVIDDSRDGIAPALDDLLGADPMRSHRAAGRSYYLGDFPRDSYSDEFVRAAQEACGAAVSPA